MSALRRQDGFSLAEMLIAVVVLAILGAVSYTTLRPSQRQAKVSAYASNLDASEARIAVWAGQAEGGEAAFAQLTATLLQQLVRSAGAVNTSEGQLPAQDTSIGWSRAQSNTQLTLSLCQSSYFNGGERLCQTLTMTRGAAAGSAEARTSTVRESYACASSATALSACTKLGTGSGTGWPTLPERSSR